MMKKLINIIDDEKADKESISIGFEKLDKITCKFDNSALIYIAARHGMGLKTFADSLADIVYKVKAEGLRYTDFSTGKVIISIRTPGDEKAEFDSNNKTIKDILYLDFYDISYNSQEIFKGYKPMSDEDAVRIRDFVLKWKDKVYTIWVHCDAGISRSTGVAAGILEVFGEDNSYIICFAIVKR